MRSTVTAPEPPAPTGPAPSELIPISVLALDLDEPGDGWTVNLRRRGIAVLEDDLGRPSIARGAARQLITERREAAVRAHEAAERNAVELEVRRLAQLRAGIPADQVPAGMTPAMAMVAAGEAAEPSAPKRQSVLEHSLANPGGGVIYHPVRDKS